MVVGMSVELITSALVEEATLPLESKEKSTSAVVVNKEVMVAFPGN